MTRCSAGSRALQSVQDAPRRRRLALLFGVVYFAQGMWYLPNQTITIVFKDAGYSAGRSGRLLRRRRGAVADQAALRSALGLLSDLRPASGRATLFLARRWPPWRASSPRSRHAQLRDAARAVHRDGLGLAFTDVLTDAVMVENGRQHGLTGAFQSVQWASIYTSSMLVGLIGGWLAQRRNLVVAFLVAACFPVITLIMTAAFVREGPARRDRAALLERLAAVRDRAAHAGALARRRLHLLLHVQSVVRTGLPLLPDRSAGLQPGVHRRPERRAVVRLRAGRADLRAAVAAAGRSGARSTSASGSAPPGR